LGKEASSEWPRPQPERARTLPALEVSVEEEAQEELRLQLTLAKFFPVSSEPPV
jgi:hypothetical protein